MKLCKYCHQKISWLGGIDHSICEREANHHKKYIINYIKLAILNDSFDFNNYPEELKAAQEYLTSTVFLKQFAYGYHTAIISMMDDAVIDETELEKVTSFRRHLEKNLDQSFDQVSSWLNIYDTDKILYMGSMLRLLKTGRGSDIPTKPPSDIILSKNEKHIYTWNNVNAHTLNKKIKYRGRSTGGTYRVSKDFSIRHTEHRGKPVSYDEWVKIGRGRMVLTNNHLFFLLDGQGRDVKEMLKNIISIDPLEDGFIVNTSLQTRPAHRFSMDDQNVAWIASNFILNAQSY